MSLEYTARLVAQGQKAAVMLENDFTNHECQGSLSEDGTTFSTKGNAINFDSTLQAQIVYCLANAAFFYYHQRKAGTTSIADLSAYALLVSMMNGCRDISDRLCADAIASEGRHAIQTSTLSSDPSLISGIVQDL